MIVVYKSQTENRIFDTYIIFESGPISRAYEKFDALRRVRDVRKCWRGRNMTLIHSVSPRVLCISAGIRLIAKGT